MDARMENPNWSTAVPLQVDALMKDHVVHINTVHQVSKMVKDFFGVLTFIC